MRTHIVVVICRAVQGEPRVGVVAVAGVVLAVALRRRELKPAQLSTDDHDLTNDSDYSSL